MVVHGDGKLVYLSKAYKEVATILTMSSVFYCGTEKVKSEGGQLIEIGPVNKKGSAMGMKAEGNGAGLSDLMEYENEKGEKESEYLRWEEPSGSGEASLETVGEVSLAAASQFTIEA